MEIIDLELEENFDRSKDPCASCRDKINKTCKETCERASMWWKTLARKFKENSL